MILTPKWQWHDHGHEGDGPMIWLDGLDLPLYHSLPTHFAEPYVSKRYPSRYVPFPGAVTLALDTLLTCCFLSFSPVPSSPLCFPWADMKKRLDDNAGDWSMETYHSPDSKYISQTLGAHAERIKAGAQSQPRRDTCAYIYHVQSGSGKSEITKPNGETKTVEWEKSDTFAVPAWSRIVHFANQTSDAYLFVLSDRPLLDILQMYAMDQTV